MSLIKKCWYLCYITPLIPFLTDRWIYDSMPYIDVRRFRLDSRKCIETWGIIICESLIIEVYIWIEAWKRFAIFMDDRKRYIPYDNRTYKTRYSFFTIPFIVEFFIFCSDRCRNCIFRNDYDRYSSLWKISLYITRIATYLGADRTICSLVDDKRYYVSVVTVTRFSTIEKRYLYRLREKYDKYQYHRCESMK